MIFGTALLAVIVGSWSFVQQISATNRCDVKRPIRYWSRCEECSINERLRCPSPYIHTSGGIGVRGCRLRINFGSIIGIVTVAGCQHTCDRKEYVKECCSGYWGSDCQGIVLNSYLYNILKKIMSTTTYGFLVKLTSITKSGDWFLEDVEKEFKDDIKKFSSLKSESYKRNKKFKGIIYSCIINAESDLIC